METYLELKKDALDKIKAELPSNSFIIGISHAIYAEGPCIAITYISMDELGVDRPKSRADMRYTFAQIEALCDGFPKGGQVTGVIGLYGYPIKVIDNVAYAHGHLERGKGEALKAMPVPQRIIDAIPEGYHVWNVQRDAEAKVLVRCAKDDGTMFTDIVVEMEAPEDWKKAWDEDETKPDLEDEVYAGYCAEYQAFKDAIALSRMWRQFMGFKVRVLLPEE